MLLMKRFPHIPAHLKHHHPEEVCEVPVFDDRARELPFGVGEKC